MENKDAEYKQSFNRASIEVLVAFANSKGGTLYVDIADDGDVIGVDLAKELIPQLISENF